MSERERFSKPPPTDRRLTIPKIVLQEKIPHLGEYGRENLLPRPLSKAQQQLMEALYSPRVEKELSPEEELSPDQAFKTNLNYLTRRAMQLGIPPAQASDAVAEALEKTWERAERPDFEFTNPLGYLVTTMRNQWVSEIRHKRYVEARMGREVSEEFALNLAHSSNPNPIDQVLLDEQILGIRQFIKNLTAPQQEVIRLLYLGFKPKEIASLMGKSHGAIKSLLFRVQRQLEKASHLK